jgi:TPR repeat protein
VSLQDCNPDPTDPQAILGTLYTGSTGVEQNFNESIKWIRSAALQGNSTGIFFLAFAYYNGGQGVRKDHVKAYAWFSLINKKDMLEKLKATFLPEQLEAAQKEAARIKTELAATKE